MGGARRGVSRSGARARSRAFLWLYRTCCEHLALGRGERLSVAPFVDRLSIVTARAHQIVYRQNDLGLARIAHVLLNRFPAMVRAHRGYVRFRALLLMVPRARPRGSPCTTGPI